MARKSEILPTDSISRRSTFHISRPSSSSSSSSTTTTTDTASSIKSTNEESLIQTLREQNRILAQRNAIYSAKITELENKLDDSNSQINKLKDTVNSLINSMELKINNDFQDSLRFIQNLRLEHRLEFQDSLFGNRVSVSSGNSRRSTSSGGAMLSSLRFSIESTKSFELPQYFKRKDQDDDDDSGKNDQKSNNGDVSTILELLELSHNEEEQNKVVEEVSHKNPIVNYSSSLFTETSKEDDKQEKSKRSQRKATFSQPPSLPPPSQLSSLEDIQSIESLVKSPTPELKQEPVDSPPRRPTRARKEVSYKPLSLNAKMRRESVKMLDAVGENVLINYSVKKSNQKDTNDNESKSTKRKPLKNITNSNNASKKRKSLATTPTPNLSSNSDLSVFDFDEIDVKLKRTRRYTTIG